MKKKHLIFIGLLISICGWKAIGQNIPIVQRIVAWQSNQSIELHSMSAISSTCQVVTKTDQTVELVWGDTKVFNVTSIDGDWADPAQEGSLIYHVTFQEVNGDITIKKEGTDTTVLIDFTSEFPGGMKLKLIINSVQ